MAYDIHLADRVREIFRQRHVSFEEKKMMGGLCYLVDDKMCVGILQSKLMARIDPEIYEKVLKKKGAEKMLFTGKEMKGFVFVNPVGTDLEKDLESWVDLCLEFNPKAKSSKGRKGGKLALSLSKGEEGRKGKK